MKRVAIYFLLFLVSFAYCCETVKIMGGDRITMMDDFDGDKNDSESEDEQESFYDELFYNNDLFLFHIKELRRLVNHQRNTAFSSNYKQEVYSPPKVG